jgi:hypothetical protein
VRPLHGQRYGQRILGLSLSLPSPVRLIGNVPWPLAVPASGASNSWKPDWVPASACLELLESAADCDDFGLAGSIPEPHAVARRSSCTTTNASDARMPRRNCQTLPVRRIDAPRLLLLGTVAATPGRVPHKTHLHGWRVNNSCGSVYTGGCKCPVGCARPACVASG